MWPNYHITVMYIHTFCEKDATPQWSKNGKAEKMRVCGGFKNRRDQKFCEMCIFYTFSLNFNGIKPSWKSTIRGPPGAKKWPNIHKVWGKKSIKFKFHLTKNFLICLKKCQGPSFPHNILTLVVDKISRNL